MQAPSSNKTEIYCEPFHIGSGDPFEIHQLSYQTNEPYQCLAHFHDVHEFILFAQIEGDYLYHQGCSALQDFDVVFTPALEVHQFKLSSRAKAWHIIQLPSDFFSKSDFFNTGGSLSKNDPLNLFQQGIHLRLPKAQRPAIQQQLAWLLESYQQDPLSEKSLTLLRLLLLWLVEYAEPVLAHSSAAQESVPSQPMKGLARLTPVFKAFQHPSGIALSMQQAAALCHLSPSHFSRQFKQAFGVSYSEYLLRHKLYLAARLLSRAQGNITEISYQLNFASPSHFIAQFKRQFQRTPLQYQKQVWQR